MSNPALDRARRSLDGLSVGDAFGELLMGSQRSLGTLELPRTRAPWPWTDDTAMALSIVEALAARGDIEPADLAARFAARYERQPGRGYGGGAHRILAAISGGVPWELASRSVFGGAGSMGNGAAMRVAPLGAYFAADDAPGVVPRVDTTPGDPARNAGGADGLARVVDAARRSALPTHAHPEGVAGAIAIAVAAAAAARGERDLIRLALEHTPAGDTHHAIARAAALGLDADPFTVASTVGNGSRVIASDTVPFCLWVATRHLDDYERALWTTASVLGDMDTTCAIVGGIVALASPIPADWLARREPLDLQGAPHRL